MRLRIHAQTLRERAVIGRDMPFPALARVCMCVCVELGQSSWICLWCWSYEGLRGGCIGGRGIKLPLSCVCMYSIHTHSEEK